MNANKRRKYTLVMLILLLSASSTFAVRSYMLSKHYEPVYHGELLEKKVSFTFDTVWDEGVTREILEIMKNHNIQGTFFVTGEWMENNPDLALKMLAYGNEIGNHTYSHENLTELPEEQLIFQIKHFEELAREFLLGYRTLLFRPPFGEYNPLVLSVASKEGYETVLWSINSGDLSAGEPGEIIKHIMKRIHPGAIILFHTSDGPLIEALPVLIKILDLRGYTIVPVSELLSLGN